MEVEIRKFTFRELQQQLVELAARGDDALPLFRVLADEFRQSQADNFARGGRPKWKPVSAEYAARKARLGRGSQVGVFSGGLRDSLTRASDPHHIERVARDGSFIVGSSNPVANLFGGKHVERKQPRRKVVTMTPTTRRDWLRRLQAYLADGKL